MPTTPGVARRTLLRYLLAAAAADGVGGCLASRTRGTPVIAGLLERNRRFDAQFARGLSNHLSMALVALNRLGASDARLVEFFDRYARQLEPEPHPTESITRATFATALGTHRRYADHLAFLRGELRALGRERLLATYLPPLLPGVAAAAFHATIRLAYGLQAEDDDEVVVSLAYLADTYLPLGAPGRAAEIGEPPVELLRRLAGTPALAGRSWTKGLITNSFVEIANQPAFAPVIDWLPASAASIRSLAEAALVLYASVENFTALHGLTSTHALRIAAPYLPDPAAAARYQFVGLCAVYVSIGTPPLLARPRLAELARRELPSWGQIAAAAVRSTDEHVIKLVYSAQEEYAVYGDPLYRYVAARKAGLVS